MGTQTEPRGVRTRLVGWLIAIAGVSLLAAACGDNSSGAASTTEPWGANTVSAADLVKELSGADKPVVVCTAPASMYRMGHIPGAVLQGPASEPRAYSELAAWAQSLPRSASVVIYCGCCPLAYCPNLRPAYNALKDMGFRRLRVLVLPENFGSDWVDKGYPVDR